VGDGVPVLHGRVMCPDGVAGSVVQVSGAKSTLRVWVARDNLS
jgi:hypothetical protein